MVDNLSEKQRSLTMSKIRSKWTNQERKIHNFLKGRKIKHKMHSKIAGSPDIILPDKKIAVFLHGCFWHRCPKCYIEPKTNVDYWLPKIRKNVKRDVEVSRKLKREGYEVLRFWEHDVKRKKDFVIQKLLKIVK